MIILIDDDKLIHMSWKLAAQKAEVELVTFFTVDEALEFLEKSEVMPEAIYIDSQLGHNIKGEIEASRLFDCGFTEIYLASGLKFKPEEIPPYIKGSITKRAPF